MSEHVLDVGGKRRIGVDIVPDLARREAKAHREAKEVDQLLAGVPDEMRAEDEVGGLIDNDFRSDQDRKSTRLNSSHT